MSCAAKRLIGSASSGGGAVHSRQTNSTLAGTLPQVYSPRRSSCTTAVVPSRTCEQASKAALRAMEAKGTTTVNVKTLRDFKQVDAGYFEADVKSPLKLPPAFDNLSEYWKPKTARALQQLAQSTQKAALGRMSKSLDETDGRWGGMTAGKREATGRSKTAAAAKGVPTSTDEEVPELAVTASRARRPAGAREGMVEVDVDEGEEDDDEEEEEEEDNEEDEKGDEDGEGEQNRLSLVSDDDDDEDDEHFYAGSGPRTPSSAPAMVSPFSVTGLQQQQQQGAKQQASSPPPTQATDVKVVLNVGGVSKIVSSALRWSELKAQLESDIGGAIALRYRDSASGQFLTLTSNDEYARLLYDHAGAKGLTVRGVHGATSPFIAPLRLIVDILDEDDQLEGSRNRRGSGGTDGGGLSFEPMPSIAEHRQHQDDYNSSPQEQQRFLFEATPKTSTSPFLTSPSMDTGGGGPLSQRRRKGPLSNRTGIARVAVESPGRGRTLPSLLDGTRKQLASPPPDVKDTLSSPPPSSHQHHHQQQLDDSISSDTSCKSDGDNNHGRTTRDPMGGSSLMATNDTVATIGPSGPGMLWQKGRRLGHGAFGVVYSALDLRTGVRFAVKQVSLAGSAGSTKRRLQGRSLQREVCYLESLRHPNVVRILGTQRTKMKLTIFLEYASDGSMETLVQEFGALTEGVIRSYTRQILDGLHYLHKNRIVHRDIKPANILIDRGVAKLADFGASKRFDEELVNQTEQGIFGTMLYMAPEVMQSVDGGGYGRRADLWSLGITLIEVALGVHPFQSLEMALQVACEPDEPLPNFPIEFTKEAHTFVAQCLVRDCKARKSAAKLRKHPFCALSDDPRLAAQYVAVNHSPTTGASSWRATATASPFVSPGSGRGRRDLSFGGVDDSTTKGVWGIGGSSSSQSSGMPTTPNWEDTGYVSPRIVSTPHTDGSSTIMSGDYTCSPFDDTQHHQQVQRQAVSEQAGGKHVSLVGGDIKERPDKLSVAPMLEGGGSRSLDQPTPLVALTPGEWRTDINDMTSRTPSFKYGRSTSS